MAQAASNQSSSLGLSVFEAIKRDILYVELRPGEQLRLRVLAERYGCGASPIREALSQLASDGWTTRVDKRGFFVARTSHEEFQDILTNRCFLESEALRRSIESGDSVWEEQVLISHHRMNRAPRFRNREEAGTDREWEDAHKRFHMTLISACSSPILIANCEKLYDLNIRYRFQARQQSIQSRNVSVEHDAIKDLVLARRTEEAIEALTSHYLRTGSFLFDQASASG